MRRTGHIRERSPGSYELRYSLGTDPGTGKRKLATFTVRGSRKDAEKELRRLLRSVDTGEHVDPTRITVREWLASWLATVREDLRYALRQMRRAPAFAAAVALTLALGIGANSAMFGLVDRLLLRAPSGVARPNDITRLYFTRTYSWAGTTTFAATLSFGPPGTIRLGTTTMSAAPTCHNNLGSGLIPLRSSHAITRAMMPAPMSISAIRPRS